MKRKTLFGYFLDGSGINQKLFQRFVIEDEGGGGGNSDPNGDGGQNGSTPTGEIPPAPAGQSVTPPVPANDSFKRYVISKAKSEAKETPAPSGQPATPPKSDEEFEAAFKGMLDTELKKYGIDKLKDIDTIKSTMETESFFKQFTIAGSPYKDLGFDIDPKKGGEILADIEKNGFTPAHLIILANADLILDKMKTLPRSPMNTEFGQKPKPVAPNTSMKDRIGAMAEKMGIWGTGE